MTLAVVTGASSGIGRALSLALAARGREVVLVGRSAAGLAATADAIATAGGTSRVLRHDITDDHFADALAACCDGPVHDLYVNAGLSAGPADPRVLETPEDTARLIAVNLGGSIATVRATLPLMRDEAARRTGRRRIGIVASIAGLFPPPDLAVYSATKAGLIVFAHALRPRLAQDGITVTALCPGFVTTPMSARHNGAKPFEIGADTAAVRMIRAVERGRRTAIMPWPYAFLAMISTLAPGPLLDRVMLSFHARIDPP